MKAIGNENVIMRRTRSFGSSGPFFICMPAVPLGDNEYSVEKCRFL
jgi:hypothetical protein